MTDGFKVGTGLKQGDRLAPNLFNIALEYVIRQLSVQTTSTIFHKSVQFIGYADDINIMGRTKRAISDVYGELKERRKEFGLCEEYMAQHKKGNAGVPGGTVISTVYTMSQTSWRILKIRKLRWASHIIRMEEERIPKKVLNRNFYTIRPVGRPRTR